MKIVVENTEALAAKAAEIVIKDLQEAIQARGFATWVIAGGTSPMAAYRILAGEYIDALDWSKVQFVIGDERCVPFEHPDSSWSQIETVFLRHVKSPANFIGRPKSNLSAEEAADHYDHALQGLPLTDGGVPRLDHLWLGVGEDGHTLSLFPDHPSFKPSDRLVIPVHNSPKPPPDRISLTLKALRGTRKCIVFASGAGKAAVISKAAAGDMALPIAKAVHEIERAGGQVTWLLDKAAAKDLQS